MNVSFLQELMNTVADQGRSLLPKGLFGSDPESVHDLALALTSVRGEASGVALARQLLARLKAGGAEERRQFYRFLADDLKPDSKRVAAAARAFLDSAGPAALAELQAAVESPRVAFFNRLNLAPGATAEIVALRRDLLRDMKGDPALAAVDSDLEGLLQTWFNRGFLVLRRIDWQTPASILEKIIAYEAVHKIKSWSDLRRRLDPVDRRCFAFFHPSLIDEPLIFVEVALATSIPGAIGPVLAERGSVEPDEEPTTAVFYSISNCQDGLKGISFGNFLLKQVVEELARELPKLKAFVTLSPVPHFARWLDRAAADPGTALLTAEDRHLLAAVEDPDWHESGRLPKDRASELEETLLALVAHYFLTAKGSDGRPVDPVARFHLGNGARLERLNWLGDPSEKGLAEAHGLMVNYRYELKEIERNHEAFANDGTVAASRAVRGLLRSAARPRLPTADQVVQLALPSRSKASK